MVLWPYVREITFHGNIVVSLIFTIFVFRVRATTVVSTTIEDSINDGKHAGIKLRCAERYASTKRVDKPPSRSMTTTIPPSENQCSAFRCPEDTQTHKHVRINQIAHGPHFIIEFSFATVFCHRRTLFDVFGVRKVMNGAAGLNIGVCMLGINSLPWNVPRTI